jgi:hypothetical protein
MSKYKPYAEKMAKVGCYSIAVVYFLVGVMAMMGYFGRSDNGADEERIMDLILDLPLGEVLIAMIIAGLLAYIAWRVYEAITDPYDFGDEKKGLARRAGIGLSAIGYLIIAFAAARMLVDGGGGNGEEEQQTMIARVLEFPGGAWIVGAVGAVTGFAGLVQFKYVATGDYHKRINFNKMPSWGRISTHILSWWGYMARGVLLAVIGYFLISAGIKSDPEEVGDTDTAFDFLGDMGTFGSIIFIAVALGTMLYGVFMVIHGIYYSFEKESER